MFPGHIKKTALVWPAGFIEYIFMPFGLRNSLASFQRFMDNLLADLPFVCNYVDDILVPSNGIHEHVEHLKIIFERLAKHGLTLNSDKCEFGVTETTFLSHRLKHNVFTPTDERVQLF